MKLKLTLLTIVGGLLATPAHAHHLMDGRPATTFSDGLLSGLAHPVIEADHLIGVIAVALVAALSRRFIVLCCTFLAAMVLGVGLHVLQLALTLADIGIGLTLVSLGLLLIVRWLPATMLTIVLFALTGVFHGSAYGSEIVGAEPTPLAGYLLGLFLIQAALALSVCLATRRASGLVGTMSVLKFSGVGCVAAGIATTLLSVMP